jgi:hypothetical protein
MGEKRICKGYFSKRGREKMKMHFLDRSINLEKEYLGIRE